MTGDKSHRMICICGHPVTRHELLGTEYARCRHYKSTPGTKARTRCACEMRARAVLWIGEDIDIRRFARNASGAQTPHALDGALEGIAASQINWMTSECFDCENDVPNLKAVALDKYGQPWIGKSGHKSTGIDTGKHALLCEDCYAWWAENQPEDILRV